MDVLERERESRNAYLRRSVRSVGDVQMAAGGLLPQLRG